MTIAIKVYNEEEHQINAGWYNNGAIYIGPLISILPSMLTEIILIMEEDPTVNYEKTCMMPSMFPMEYTFQAKMIDDELEISKSNKFGKLVFNNGTKLPLSRWKELFKGICEHRDKETLKMGGMIEPFVGYTCFKEESKINV